VALDIDLSDEVALVTGGGSSGDGFGTGKAIAVLLARAGARVVVVDTVPERAQETVALIAGEGGEATSHVADVADSDDCRAMVRSATEAFGRLTVLVNNVGVFGVGEPDADGNGADVARLLTVNVGSVIHATTAAAPAMREAGRGAVVNIGSIAAFRAVTTGVNLIYSAAKGGVDSVTRTLAVQYGPDNIRVNSVAPGTIPTPRLGQLMSAGEIAARQRLSPLGEGGDSWDVAWATAYLVSPAARWITGITLPVDGGMLATTPLAVPAALETRGE
jgi:NAD(P)-dependent dehydrogenase (short-subunit alcohol dehydrogenase family)